MKIHYKKSDIFIPEWNGNKKLPKEEQIKFHHRFLTTEERKSFVYWEDYTEGQMTILSSLAVADKMTEKEQENALAKDDRRFVQDAKGIALAVVEKIENFSLVSEDNKETKITDIKTFYKGIDAYTNLRAELEQYCLGLSARADSKN